MPCMSLLLAKSSRITPSIAQACRRAAFASLRLSSFLATPESRRNIMAGSSASGVNHVADIPTLAQLHADGELSEPEDKPQFGPDEALNKRVSIWRGDITTIDADMIVNAANKSLLGGGGVDGAIHRAAGPELLAECRGLGGAETGETKVTKGYNLPAKFVAHTVGPVYAKSQQERSARLLESCYKTSLHLAAEHGAKSIGFSSISTGIYGYPIIDATHIALRTTRQFLESNTSVERVIYVVFSKKDEDVYKAIAPEYFPKA